MVLYGQDRLIVKPFSEIIEAANLLEGIDGVEEAVVDLDAGTAIVTLGSDVSDEMLVAAVVEEGYEAQIA